MTGDIVYLTGSSGFIGQMIVDLCETDANIAKVYCPIRDKNGESGTERFSHLFGDKLKARYVSDTAPIPEDTTLLILNAYSVKFARPIVEILNDNVKPMLQLLDQCEETGRKIRGISVVSTAYVQPPLPFRRDPDNRIDFLLRHHTTAYELYQDLVNGNTTPDQVMSKIDPNLKDFYTANCYAFSKHIMEHVIHEKYSHLPVCVVRPSIVAPSRDGRHGHGVRSGFSLFLDLARHPILRFPRNEGKLSLVYVEDVAADVIKGAREWAKPAVKSQTTGAPFHPILSSTTASETDALASFYASAPSVYRFDVRNAALRSVLRSIEVAAITMSRGKKAANMLDKVYQNFDPIMKDQWDFQATHPNEDIKLMMDRYYAVKEEKEGSDESSTINWWDGGNTLFVGLLLLSFFSGIDVSPSINVVRLFILLRMLVLLAMQSVFYGDTPIRTVLPATLNERSHDARQHDREETIWPSVLVSGVELYALFALGLLPDPTTMELSSWNSFYLVVATHALPVEFIYYWGHRWMHDFPSLYKVHKHHHLSIVPSPKTSVTFLWSEHVFYDIIFALPILVPVLFHEATIASTLFYIPVFDFLNTLGHTNLEVFPKWYINSPFYYFFYCTTYHHVHHKYFKYNYALFMPIYDIIFGTYSRELTVSDFMAAQKRVTTKD